MELNEFNKVEKPALEQLQSLGWSYIEGAKLSPSYPTIESDERDSFKDVVLERRLSSSLKLLNPWINDENLRKVVRILTKTIYSNFIEANQQIWNLINQCISVKQDLGKGNQSHTVHIIDFKNPENNEFLCTNQFKVAGINQNIIPDILCFVNGLPLAVIECKSPYTTNPMEAGIDQLLRYANRREPENLEGAEKLFHYNSIMVSTHRDKAAFGSITSGMEHYLEWKDPYPLTVEQLGKAGGSQEVLIAGLFSKANFLDILQNFTVFEPVNGRIIKKIPRYHQFRAVHKCIERIKAKENSKEKSGVIWHTQGSGKSLTMVFLTIKMRRDPVLREYKLVFLTDRKQLDAQLTSTFKNTQGETIHHADSVKALKELLTKDASDIVTGMVQKFQDTAANFEFPVLNESEKIILVADEAHRTQYGTLGAAINAALPNASRIGFTGTPLIKSQKTAKTFGSYIDTYPIDQAVKDGATIQILYEGREPDLRVVGDSLDSLFDEVLEDRSIDEKAEIKRRFGTSQAILEAPNRIRRVCIDISKHYRKHIQPNGFKAMIVTSSRNAAIIYKEQLDKLNGPQSAVIISGDHNDEQRFWEYTDSTKQKKQIEDFKKPLGTRDGQSELSFLIVKDMLLTGFDAPNAQVMYLDRKLTDHSLLQTIARVNRTNKNKFRGYIVDYYGLSDYLTEALEMFSSEDVAGALVELKEELPKLKNAHTRVIKHFDNLDLDDLDACTLALEDEVKRQVFQTDFRTFARQLDIILPDPSAAPFLADLKKFGKISISARNMFRDEQLDLVSIGAKVRELIEEHVFSTGVNQKIKPLDLLAVNYKEELNKHKSSRSRASEVEHAIKHHIKISIDEDPEYYKKLSERLEGIIEEHEGRWDELVQLLLEFRGNIESDHQQKASDLGLSPRELSFYNVFIAGLESQVKAEEGQDSALDEKTIEKAKDVIHSIDSMLDKATQIVEFFDKEDQIKTVRKNIKHTFIKNFDTPLPQSVIDQFMELAEVKFRK